MCRASVHALRGVDLILRAGESAVVVGRKGAGKSTLLLVAAGLMSADAGECRWFGESRRAAAARRTLYHSTVHDLMRAGSMDEPHVHLVDVPTEAMQGVIVQDWIERCCANGDSVLAVSEDLATAQRVSTRVLLLDFGRLQFMPPVRARVAEFVDPSFQRV